MIEGSELMNLLRRSSELSGRYENVVIAALNDHVVRLALMTEPYFWHFHPDSDELFIGVEGTLLLEVEDQQIELHVGDTFTVPQGVKHRTAPIGERSVNLTIERAQITTIRSDGAPS